MEIDLKTGMGFASTLTGLAAAIPSPASPYLKIASVGLGIGSQLVNPNTGTSNNAKVGLGGDNNKNNPGAVDVTNLYRQSNPYVDAPKGNNNNWYGANNSAAGFQDVMNNIIPYGGNNTNSNNNTFRDLGQFADPNSLRRMPTLEVSTIDNPNNIPGPQDMNMAIPSRNTLNTLNLPNLMQSGVIDPKFYGNTSDGYMQQGMTAQNSVSGRNPNSYYLSQKTNSLNPSNIFLGKDLLNAKNANVEDDQEFLDLVERKNNIDKNLKKVNRYNTIVGLTSAGIGLASIINELNKKPSTMMKAPQYQTVNLNGNQSAAINYAENLTNQSKNAQLRTMLDIGIDPILANTIVNMSANTQMLGAYANAENTRQQIESQQAQINASIQAQANQAKMQTDQFNIQKQMTENQLASKNISQSLMAITGSIAGIGKGNWDNFAMSEYLKNQSI